MADDTTIGGVRGKAFLTDDGIAEDLAGRLVDEFDHALEAVDDAAQGGDRLSEMDGIGPATIDELASLSPLTPPGEWTTEKLAAGHYRFTAGSATVQMIAGTGTAADVLVDHDGDAPLHLPAGFHLDDKTWSWTTAWWGIRRLMAWNPQGPGSDVPRNVATPGGWSRWQNQSNCGYNIAGWRHADTGVGLTAEQCQARVDGQAAPDDDHRLVVQQPEHTHTSEYETVAEGTWAEVLDAAEATMQAAPDGDLDEDAVAPVEVSG